MRDFAAKIKGFLKSHENFFQVVKFTLLSCVAAVVEVASLNILLAALKKYGTTEVHWFIFQYGVAEGGLRNFVAFIVSTILAQAVSYIVNRKKTFNANNNIIFSVVTFIVMEVVIIGLQIWSGPLLTGKIAQAGVSAQWASNISKFTWMFMSFVFVFLMDKFVIMRRKKEPAEESSEAALSDCGELAAAPAADVENAGETTALVPEESESGAPAL